MQHPLKITVIVQDHRNQTRVRSTAEAGKADVGRVAQELAENAAAHFKRRAGRAQGEVAEG